MHDPGMLDAEIAEHLRHRLDPAFGKGADQQTLDEGRVGEGTEEVEYRARAKLRPCRPDIAHRAMIKRREHETDLRLADSPRPNAGPSPESDAPCGPTNPPSPI